MDITLLYFDGCPNWEVADRRLAELAAERPGITVTRHQVSTAEEAEELGFGGSPSILVDGVDAFGSPRTTAGLTRRLYRTPAGLAGAPTLDQLRGAIDGPPPES